MWKKSRLCVSLKWFTGSRKFDKKEHKTCDDSKNTLCTRIFVYKPVNAKGNNISDLKKENSTAAAKYLDDISSHLETISALKNEIEQISLELVGSRTRSDELQAQLACEGEMRHQIELVLAENQKLSAELEVSIFYLCLDQSWL